MPPKKKPQKQSNRKATSASSSSSSSKANQATSSAPRLQISAENENRLRRLLLNSGHSTQSQSQSDLNPQDSLSKAQKAKKLKALYEKLSCEGFSNDQIELALSSLKVISFNFFPYIFSYKRNFIFFSILSSYPLTILIDQFTYLHFVGWCYF